MDNHNDLGFNNLLKSAFLRLKDRIFNYFLGSLLYALINIVITLVLVSPFLLKYFFPKYFDFNSSIIIMVFPFSVILSFVILYINTWFQLALNTLFISPQKIGPINALKQTRHLIKDYFIYILLLYLFYILLVPIFIGTLFVELFFWGVFSTYAIFIYLEKNIKGLDILWYSKAYVEKNKSIFIYALMTIMFYLTVQFIPLGSNIFIIIIKQILTYLFPPFMICFYYENFKSVDGPVEVKSPRKWFIAGIIGWVILLMLVLSSFVLYKDKVSSFFLKNSTKNSIAVTPTPTSIPVGIGYWSLGQNTLSIYLNKIQISVNDQKNKNYSIISRNVKSVFNTDRNAGKFTGEWNSLIQLPKQNFINKLTDNDFTIKLSINRLSTGNNILVSNTNNDDGGFAVLVGNLGEVYCRTSTGYSYIDSYTDYDGKYVIAGNGWHEIAVVRNGENCDIYVDGINRTFIKGNHSIIKKGINRLTIGAYPTNRPTYDPFFKGSIETIVLYNYALTPEQINQNALMQNNSENGL